MSSPRFGRLHKAAALVPLALLAAAWTANIAGVGSPAASEADHSPTLPDSSSLVPDEAIDAPASVSDGQQLSRRVAPGEAARISADAEVAGIPPVALAAYHRAAQVIDSADEACRLPWELIAAIGRVESGHGSANGNQLDSEGVARPGIYGVPLDGSRGTRAISDTDGGKYDGDGTWDRAVGPMQFIPSTWSAVAVDADGDTQRNPQDVQDAALGSAVYLCSGSEDLGTDSGRRSALYRYNHSTSYVELVLGVMESYLAGDFTTVPVSSTYGSGFSPTPFLPGSPSSDQPSGFTSPSSSPTAGPTWQPSDTPTDGPGYGPHPGPSTGPDDDPGGPTGDADNDPDGDPDSDPDNDPTEGPTGGPTSDPPDGPPTGPTPDDGDDHDGGVLDDIVDGVGEVLNPPAPPPTASQPSRPSEETPSWAEAQAQCLASGISALQVAALDACIENLLS